MKDAFCDPKIELITIAFCVIKYATCMYPQMLASVTF